MAYNIIKWITFILGTSTTIFFVFTGEDRLWLLLGFAFFLFVGPRLENSMDKVYCGQLVANHKIKGTDIAALILIILEIVIDFTLFPLETL